MNVIRQLCTENWIPQLPRGSAAGRGVTAWEVGAMMAQHQCFQYTEGKRSSKEVEGE